jgi:16S rRNA (adenine1518-N6/adenine1519-N6)-dimethyltransferase
MDLTNVNTIRSLLQKRGLRPNKVMGQHFLISKKILSIITDAAAISSDDQILEAGPGLGVLTLELAKRASKVLSVEKDKEFIPILNEILSDFKNVSVIEGDILQFEPAAYGLQPRRFKIVSDLPYYLTSRFFRKFLESETQPSLMILLVQKEVAERMTAKPPRANLLSNAVNYYAKPTVITNVDNTAFYPPPEIDSAVVKIEINRDYDHVFDKTFFNVLKKAFSTPRKQLLASLSKFYDRGVVSKWLLQANISGKIRPSELTVESWIILSEVVKNNPSGPDLAVS